MIDDDRVFRIRQALRQSGRSGQTEPVSIFYSYSHKDEDLRLELEAHLSALRRSGLISEWHDRKIDPGQEWKNQIDQHLDSAQLILLLVSADFIDSGYCMDVEVARARDRHRQDQATIVPIILRPVMWQVIPWLRELQVLPKDALPITQWTPRDLAYVSVCEGILRLLHKPTSPATFRATSSSKARKRFFDAAIPARVPLKKPSTLLVMVRRADSPGLMGEVEAQPGYHISADDVKTKPATLHFPKQDGIPQPIELIVNVESPDFEPNSQSKIIHVPPKGDSQPHLFFLRPSALGDLMLNVELCLGNEQIASCMLRTAGTVGETEDEQPGQRVASAAALEEEAESELEETRDRTAAAHVRRKRTQVALIASVLVAVLVPVTIGYLHRESKFREKDTIVLADVDNRTGERGWDAILKLALTNDLQDSQYLNVLSDQTVSETLKMMNWRPGEPLTKDLAKQICVRNGNKALLTASISKMGEQYHLDLRAVNCVIGITLARADADADSKEKVIVALKEASNELRQKLGESQIWVMKASTPLPQATTASLEALQEYAIGLKMKAARGSVGAVPFYKRAIELDPEFADAYAALGAAYSDLGEDTLSMENSRKAYELRDHVSSQRERFDIEGIYYDTVTGEMERANQIYLDWIQHYPDDHRPHQGLGANYSDMGQYEKAVEEEKRVLQLQPNNVHAFTSLVGDYLALEQPQIANDICEQARKRNLDDNVLGLYRYYTAFLQDDAGTMQKQLEWAMGRPGAEDVLLSAQADTEAFYGRFDRARHFKERAAQSAKNADMEETAAGWKANAALYEAEVGNKVQARAIAYDALKMSRGRDVEVQIALALARAGQLAQAERIAAKVDAELPRSTMVQNYWLPTIRGAIELERNNPTKAIELLEETVPYELGNSLQGHMYPAYIRGEAYLKLGLGHEAAGEFQKILDHRGVVLNFVIGSLARLQLARAAAMSGDTVSARRCYEDFLKLWKSADPNLPVLNAAQTEYKSLQ